MNKYIKVFNRLFCLFLYSCISIQAQEVLPEKVVFLYDQSLNLDNPSEIIQKIHEGKYVDTINPEVLKVYKSAWVYIPGSELIKDTTRNYILTGHFDNTDLYKYNNGAWEKAIPGGLYMKFSEKSPIASRYSFRLFDSSQDIADGYLVACRRRNDFSSSFMEGKLMSFSEVEEWKHEIQKPRDLYIRITLFFLGMLSMTTMVLFFRFILSKDRAYLMYAIGNVLFTIVCVLYYYSDAVNIQNFPLDDPKIALSLSGPLYLLGVAGLYQSFKYFYPDSLTKKLPSLVATLCVLIAVVNFLLNYFFELYFFTNVLMHFYLTLAMTMMYATLLIFKNRIKKQAVSSSFFVILYGSALFSISVIIGVILSIVFENNTFYFGKFYLLIGPLLIGISAFNIFILVAFSSRDHQLSEKANKLKIRAYEFEVKVLQSSLNPHFIFNSLNLIDFFIYRKDLPQARSTLSRFSDLLRMVINKTGEKTISLEKELKMLDLYLDLECSRNKNLFTYNIEVSREVQVSDVMIPPLLIQPLVENSVKHGILNQEIQKGHISILIFKSEQTLIIEVKDNGVGFKKTNEIKLLEESDRKHLGLELTRKRLMLFSKKSELIVKHLPEGQGACIIIKTPL